MRSLDLIFIVKLALVMFVVGGCAVPAINIGRNYDDYDSENEVEMELYAMSPDSFIERFGEPDEWSQDGEGDRPEMTAVWHCLDGERRELTWRLRQRDDSGREFWNVIRDESGKCEGQG